MATSGVFNGIDTVQQIVTDALLELQVLSANQTPKDSYLNLGIRRLNWLLKQWQDDGVNLWRQKEVTITWPAATAEANLESLTAPVTGVNDIIDLAVVQTGGNRSLARWEYGDYVSLPNRTSPGTPTTYTVTREVGSTKLRLWPVPATQTTLLAVVDRRIEDVTAGTQTIDVPQEYTRAVMMGLAAALAAPFGKIGEPHGQYIVREAARLYQLMRANDRPASYFFLPDGPVCR